MPSLTIIAVRQWQHTVKTVALCYKTACLVLTTAEKFDDFTMMDQTTWNLIDPELAPMVDHPTPLGGDVTASCRG